MVFDLEQIASNFEMNGMNFQVVDTGEEAKVLALEMIGEKVTVGCGGSQTTRDIGLIDALYEKTRARELFLYDRHGVRKKSNASKKLEHDMLTADWYVSSCQALIKDGRIVNGERTGNRSMVFLWDNGPQLIVIAGQNKLVNNYSEALERIHKAAMMNIRRKAGDTRYPVTSIDDMWRSTIEIKKCDPGRINIIYVKQDLGY